MKANGTERAKNSVQVCENPVLLSGLPVAGALDGFVLNDLNPVSIWIQEEGDILHPSIGEALLPADLQRLEASACRIKVIDRNA
jgi:hypothetical protein